MHYRKPITLVTSYLHRFPGMGKCKKNLAEGQLFLTLDENRCLWRNEYEKLTRRRRLLLCTTHYIYSYAFMCIEEPICLNPARHGHYTVLSKTKVCRRLSENIVLLSRSRNKNIDRERFVLSVTIEAAATMKESIYFFCTTNFDYPEPLIRPGFVEVIPGKGYESLTVTEFNFR